MAWTWNVILNKLQPSWELRPLVALFPAVVQSDVQAALKLILLTTPQQLLTGAIVRVPYLLSRNDDRLISWRGNHLSLPYRVYFREPRPEQIVGLTIRQRQVLHCFYLRHHDGYVRQRHLEALFALSAGGAPEEFTTPFTFSLLGEYVQEILEVLAQHLTPALVASYVQLIRENPLYWQQTQGRVASYWDVYYRTRKRGAPRFKHYVGARILATLQQACRQADSN